MATETPLSGNSNTADISAPLSSIGGRSQQQAMYDKQMADLDALLQEKGSRTPWFKIAQGFLSPTRSGSFGESLGNAAGAMGEYQAEQEKNQIPLAQARLGLLQSRMTAQKEADVKSLLPNLYTTTKDSSGVEKYVFNPEVAQRLGAVTGDQKYLAMIPEEMKKSQLQVARDNLFKVEEGSTGLNKQASKQLYSLDPKEFIEASKNIPAFRRAGMLPTTGAEGTPFDAIALQADGPFKAAALEYAKMYKDGAMKDEDVEKYLNSLTNGITQNMTRQDALQFQQQNAALMRGIQAGNLEESKRMHDFLMSQEIAKTEEKKKEYADKLTPQQKLDYEKLVLPVVTRGQNALNVLDDVQNLKRYAEVAPTGVASGVWAGTVGALTGSDENTALRQMQRTVKKMMTEVPHLPGSQSDRDAKNIETSLGKLDDPKLTLEQRRTIIKDIEKGYTKMVNDANSYKTYFDTYKTVPPIGGSTPPTRPINNPSSSETPGVIDFSQMPKRNK